MNLVFSLFVATTLNFSPHPFGVVTTDEGASAGCARVTNVYGRRMGDALDVCVDFVYPDYALGRDGKVSALKLGSASSAMPGSKPAGLSTSLALPVGKPSTQLLWFYVYDQPQLDCSVALLYSKFGWEIGERVLWGRAGWGKGGFVNGCVGIGKKGSCSFSSVGRYDDGTPKPPVAPNAWHQLVLTLDGTNLVLYIDGRLMDKKPCGYLLDDAKGQGLKLSLGETSDAAYFKTDFCAVYDRVWSAQEVAADFAKGSKIRTSDEQAALRKWRALQLPCGTSGYFAVNEKIPLKQGNKVVKEFSFAHPGVYNIEYEGKRFTVGVAPALPRVVSDIAMSDLVNLHPEAIALGVRRSVHTLTPRRDVADWRMTDAISDACAAKNVKGLFIAAENFGAKPLRYLGARYDNMKVVNDVSRFKVITVQGDDKHSALLLLDTLYAARKEGAHNILLQVAPWTFTGEPCWLGIALAAFNAVFPPNAATDDEKFNHIKKDLGL